MRTKRAVLYLSSTRVELALVRGRSIVATRAARLTAGEMHEDWEMQLKGQLERIAGWVAELECAGAETAVLYAGPDVVAGIFSSSSEAGKRTAIGAARLSLADACPFDLNENPWATELVASDRAVNRKRNPEARESLVHVLGIADSDNSANALAGLVRGAGLRPEALLPANAVEQVATVRSALQDSDRDKTILTLHMYEHGCVLAATRDKHLLFVRHIGIGTESMAQALTRPITVPSDDEPVQVQLDLDEARDLLFESGVPGPNDMFDEERGLSGKQILPLLQPVLQRCAVETKQSLRFSLEGEERDGAELRLTGEGARIEGLAQVIASQCDLNAGSSSGSSLSSVIESAVDLGSIQAKLVPLSAEAILLQRRIRRALWAGTAAAGLLLGLDALYTQHQIGEVAMQAAQVEQAHSSQQQGGELRKLADASELGITEARGRINALLGDPPDWGTVLEVISHLTPPTVSYESIQLSDDGGAPSCVMSGFARASSLADVTDALTSLVSDLRATPIFLTSELGSMQRNDADGDVVQAFEIKTTLHALPGKTVGRLSTAQEQTP